MPSPTADSPWLTPSPREVATLLSGTTARWWLSGGVAMDHWLGEAIRPRPNTDVSTTGKDLPQLVADLPPHLSAWVAANDSLVAWADADQDSELHPVRLYDENADAWALQVNVEDGIDRAWLYRRDPRLQLPWDRAVLDVDGIPTGAPEVQLVWKALRPRPEDEVDHDAILPKLSEEAVAFYETALLRIHPHSTWAIHVRSPFAPAKASWNKKRPD
ncbi:nucleotidyltransferase domain-containing protein [Microbacterium gorillae]|uniref:nucleotidyltransferase domain-containing protein n=1 Tax=Microbacterium gorillae TaxID=1231063 RepID=UPI00058DBDDC|nr:hypothetical protein [Microbacterium gorillae]